MHAPSDAWQTARMRRTHALWPVSPIMCAELSIARSQRDDHIKLLRERILRWLRIHPPPPPSAARRASNQAKVSLFVAIPPTSIAGYGIVYYDRMGPCPRRTRQILFASGPASPARRLQILRRRVLLVQVPQRGGGVVVMRVILAKKCRKMH
jgi:hypothetical protein